MGCSGGSRSTTAAVSDQASSAPLIAPETPASLARSDDDDDDAKRTGGAAGPQAPDTPAPTDPVAIPSVMAVASPAATAPPNPNLLSYARGAYIRSWSVGAAQNATALALGKSWTIVPAFTGTASVVFELPAVAAIDRIDVAATKAEPAQSVTVHIDVSTTGPAQFQHAGDIALSANASAPNAFAGFLAGPISARWLRLSVERSPGAALSIDSVTATGSLAVPHLAYTGTWGYADDPGGANDVVFKGSPGMVDAQHPIGTPAWQAATLETASSFEGGACNFVRPLWHGSVTAGSAVLNGSNRLTVVAGGNLLVGNVDGESILAKRIARADTCTRPTSGTGPEILVIARTPSHSGGESNGEHLPGHRFVTMFLPTFGATDLGRAQSALLAYDCDADTDLSAAQRKALIDYVVAGHLLTIRDSDWCSHSHYGFLPFAFTTSNAGGSGKFGNVLAVVDPSVLGAVDASDRAHFIDTKAYLAAPGQQLGDTSVMKTDDAHWCGLFFARNSTGHGGWVQAYARLGRGIVLFNGFDVDDLDHRIPPAERIAQLDYALSAQTDLPCSTPVADPLMIWSSVLVRRPAGVAKDLVLPFRVAHQDGMPRHHIHMSLAPAPAPGWATRIDRPEFDLGDDPQTVNVHVHVPAAAPAVPALYTLTATDDGGTTAHASIGIQSDQALATALERGGRARIYGIHFDVASARIQARSEQTIREIASVLNGHPAWRMRIEGHTDSDGSATYNSGLSERRAQAVVARLTSAYHIARKRLSSAGYGATRPVASNATEAGKALNRRVELVRL